MARKERITTVEDVRRLASTCDRLGVKWKWTGLCFWAMAGYEGRQARELAKMGANWSAKRGAHYWRIPDGLELPRIIEGVTV